MENYSTCVLITAHNRIKQTQKCLEHLFENKIDVDVYLVDDGFDNSISDAISKRFPEVNIVEGDGGLYWNGGMRKAWEYASKIEDYDFYIWLNNDTYIFENAISKVIQDYELLEKREVISLIIGACKDPISGEVTYGAKRDDGSLIEPNGVPQKIDFINGNFVLVPQKIFKSVGYLSKSFTHSYGDVDYGLRANKNGYSNHLSSKYLGKCKSSRFDITDLKFKDRMSLLFDKKHSYLNDFIKFKFRHSGFLAAFIAVLSIILKTINPKIHSIVSNR